MKQFLVKILIFGSLFFIVEKGFYLIVKKASEKEYDKRLELIIKGEMEKDILIIGSSRGANNISAKQLEAQTMLNTYNLSYRGSDVMFHEFILKTVLKYNKKPKKVLLFIDNGYQFIEEQSLNFRFDRLKPLKKYNYINNQLIQRNQSSYFSKFLYALRLNKTDFSFKKLNVKEVNIMTTHGSKMLRVKPNDSLQYLKKIKKFTDKEDATKIESFKSIQNICKHNNIALYFVFSPGFKTFNTVAYNRFKTFVNPEEHVIVYDTTRYKDKNLFRDHGHLFKNGAKLFTKEVSAFINKENN